MQASRNACRKRRLMIAGVTEAIVNEAGSAADFDNLTASDRCGGRRRGLQHRGATIDVLAGAGEV